MSTLFQVAWSNPYKPRPEGFPAVMLSMEAEKSYPCPVEINECWEEMREYGYAVFVSPHIPEPKQLPLASKQKIRRRNLWKRLLKRYPMFCSDFYAERVQSKPEHYGAFTPGEFADVEFAYTTMGNLKIVRKRR